MISPAAEDYLKTIFKMGEGAPVSTNDLAEELGVAAPSVTGMVKRLASLGLVEHRAYRGVTLTESGRTVALEVIRHHRLLERYLREVVGLDWAEIHEEAEILEHHISEAFEARIDALLGFPTHDPHGDPIPTLEGEMGPTATAALADALPGHYRVARVADHDPALLGALEALGLLPGAALHLDARLPGGALRLIGSTPNAFTLPPETARHVFVEPEGHPQA